MNKALEIAEGFKNIVRSKLDLTSEEEENLFKVRREICDACINKNILICDICKCVISAKTKSIQSSCPIQLW